MVITRNRKILQIATIIFYFSLLISLPRATFADEVTITTYYPAPYGVYKEFKTTGDTSLATDSGSVGIGTDSPDGVLGVNGEINFVPQDSEPSSNEGSLYYDNTADEFKYYNGSIWQAVGGGGGPESWTCTARSQRHSTCAYDQLCIAEVSCQGDEKAISGGCEVPMGRFGGHSWMVNRPTNQGWRCVESSGNSLVLYAWANCCE